MAAKINKSLRTIAREISDTDEFEAHIANVARRYRTEQALSDRDRQREMRRVLRDMQRHATAILAFLQQAHRKAASAEKDAFHRVRERIPAPDAALTSWLEALVSAANETTASGRTDAGAPSRTHLVVAEALRATFEYHRLTLTAPARNPRNSAIVRLFMSMAAHAGDAELTPEIARAAIVAVKTTQPAPQ